MSVTEARGLATQTSLGLIEGPDSLEQKVDELFRIMEQNKLELKTQRIEIERLKKATESTEGELEELRRQLADAIKEQQKLEEQLAISANQHAAAQAEIKQKMEKLKEKIASLEKYLKIIGASLILGTAASGGIYLAFGTAKAPTAAAGIASV